MYFLCKNKNEFQEKKMLIINRLEYLKDKEEGDSLMLIKNKLGNPLATMRSLNRKYNVMASLSWLDYKNKEKFKKNCYIAGKLKLLGEEELNWACTGYNIYNFFKIIMSDNKDLISYLVKNIDSICYETKPDYHRGFNSNLFLNKTTLLAIKGDWKKLKERSLIFLNDVPKDMKKRIPDFEFFLGLSEKNVEKMEEALNKLLIPRNAKIAANDTETYYDFYLQVQVLMYGKIASMHGIDLNIESELAPKELMKYEPLPDEEYENPYEFMKEFDYNKPQIEWIKKYSTDDED